MMTERVGVVVGEAIRCVEEVDACNELYGVNGFGLELLWMSASYSSTAHESPMKKS